VVLSKPDSIPAAAFNALAERLAAPQVQPLKF
jgi:hypothetical protein